MGRTVLVAAAGALALAAALVQIGPCVSALGLCARAADCRAAWWAMGSANTSLERTRGALHPAPGFEASLASCLPLLPVADTRVPHLARASLRLPAAVAHAPFRQRGQWTLVGTTHETGRLECAQLSFSEEGDAYTLEFLLPEHRAFGKRRFRGALRLLTDTVFSVDTTFAGLAVQEEWRVLLHSGSVAVVTVDGTTPSLQAQSDFFINVYAADGPITWQEWEWVRGWGARHEVPPDSWIEAPHDRCE